MDVTPYEQKLAKEWDDFVQKSPNGNLFNRREFLAYHPPERFKDASFLIHKKGNILSVVPGILTQNGEKWVSHGGASYGGFVLGAHRSFEDCKRMVESSLDYVKSLGAKSMTITIPPSFYNREQSDYIEANLLYQGFQYVKRELTNACGQIHSQFFEDWVNKARGATRHSISSGVTIHNPPVPTEEDLTSFYHILKTNRDGLGVGITHTLEDLRKLFALVPNSLDLYLARKEGVDVGCGLVFQCNPKVDLIFYIAHLKEHQDLKPIHILVHSMYEKALARKTEWIDYGTSTRNGKLTNNGMLLAFKENFNMLGYFRSTLSREI